MKKSDIAAVWAAACMVLYSAAGYSAEEESDDTIGTFAGSAKLASDYMFRSISNSNNRPQVNVDFNWTHDSGVYLGVWSTNTDFGGTGNSMELDPYIGVAGDIGDSGFSYDVGYWAYFYPGSPLDLDYGEVYITPSYSAGNITISPSFWYSDNYFGDDFLNGVESLAYEVTVSANFQRDISISARVGEQTFQSKFDALNYTYWDIGIGQTWNHFTFDLRWHDTNGVNPFLANPKLGDGEIVFSITRSF